MTAGPMLSRNFSLEEMCRTSSPLPNYPTRPEIIANLTRLCDLLLQPIRDEWGPLIIRSGYRSPEVNAQVGGSPTSQHLLGEAADFVIQCHDVGEVYRWIARRGNLMLWGQLIWERPLNRPEARWVHISLPNDRHLCERLVWDGHKYEEWQG